MPKKPDKNIDKCRINRCECSINQLLRSLL
ncbi:hypothetical protein FSB73_07060 [Arachidicoccus ginsenosidivorans]|uniref:Uncharacterized protein n=1 Tax=Arachidicoccus ginsenosidivorans TaxID=496057 RepID=A0A5B8VIT5_9BACT|nr:hypothetical protein FSB73_07060 [Arachidicoccus ginsenosidivorans]